ISKIADAYNVPSELIVSWNGLKNVHKIRAGQQLALYIDDGDKTIAVKKQRRAPSNIVKSSSNKNSSIIILAEQKKFSIANSTPFTTKVSWYQVRQGDSLWTIARKFNLSTKQLKSLNKLKSNRIKPGIKLKISNV
ncbi:MAG TPA: LysM peptidoglycan-binding domain-containing protein, partial [Desulfobacterales bacterium]|nr:LysM peptidoglycan-binding domain-containing protein [Desulfobacterales bacterium]